MGVDFSGSHSAMDTKQHERTYVLFVRFAIFCALAVAAVLSLMAIFLT